MDIVSFLVFLLILGLVIWAICLFIDWLPLPAPAGMIAKIIVAIVALLLLLQRLPSLGIKFRF